ncbi:hypothetical protein GBAR_LOCUS2808, partial [Geodia barretti]
MTESKSSRTPTPTESRSSTPTGKRAEGSPPAIMSQSSPRLQRANSASARFNFHSVHKKQNSVPLSGLTSAVQAAQSTRESSLSNSYEEIGSPTLPKVSPQAPTIDQLLSEIEQECHGPDYKYSPPANASPRGPSEAVWVSPCKFSPPEGRQGFSQDAWVYPYGSMTPNISTRKLRRNSFQDVPFHQKSASLDGYETQRDGGGGFSISSNVSYLPPHEMRAVQNAVDRTFEDYETIPYHPSSDDDTYVYMAPSSPQPSHSRYIYTVEPLSKDTPEMRT